MGKRRKRTAPLHHPAWWPTWVLVGLAWVLGQLPWRPLLALGRGLGWLAWRFGGARRRVVETNLALCFPEKPEAERAALTRATLLSTGEAMTEIAGAYTNRRFNAHARLELDGFEHLEAARATGQGVLLLGMHFNTLDIAGRLLGEGAGIRFSAVYRPHDNAVFDWLIRYGRSRYTEHYFDRHDMRSMIRYLRNGGICWYAPDQDYGTQHAVYAPFFGVPAATITGTARIARMSRAVVIPISYYRLPGGQYRLTFDPPLTDFPSGEDIADATRVNQTVETAVLRAPEQYLWVHRRFKHQADGPSPYGPRRRRHTPR